MITSHDQRPPPTSSEDEDETVETSPESAALARGAARTAASARTASSATTAATRGAITGRIPVASRTVAAAKASKIKTTTIGRHAAATPKIKISAPRPPRVVVARNAAGRGSFPKSTAPKTGVSSLRPKVKVTRPVRAVRAPRGGSSSSTPRLSSRIPKARANTIAKASDRASKGFDVLSAGLEQNHSVDSNSTNGKKNTKLQSSLDSGTSAQRQTKSSSTATTQILKSITPALQQITSFGRTFVTNAVLGMAVFATYEGVIESIAPSSVGETRTDDRVIDDDDHVPGNASIDGRSESETNSTPRQLNDHIAEEDNDDMDRATLSQHFLAGALGGAAHALLSLPLEVKLNASSSDVLQSSGKATNHTFQNVMTRKPVHFQVPALNYSSSFILHHSLAHAVLFGSYQLTKRLFLQCIPPSSSFDDSSTINTNTNNGGSSSTHNAIHVASIAMAGGLAGQFQHVTSHFTEQWLGLAAEEAKESSLRRRVAVATWPTWRSTAVAFPPSAIGFLAFEYGKFMIAGEDVDE
mmetsp:Transcript_30378/g.65574  ORF Transcript_30378/g.65574 Transcript_30378/m.65574 type:complete len:526 (+) Transcript_30378:54-1631(+)